MKTRPIKHILTAVAASGLILCTTANAAKSKAADQAYELRMEGKADAALVMLEQALEGSPDDAAVWYELARTRAHIGLGNPQAMMEEIKQAEAAAIWASKLEPESLIYATYKAKTCGMASYIAMRSEPSEAKAKVPEVLAAYEQVLKLKPEYHEARLALVEYLKVLPPEMGGDPEKAETYTKKLEKADPVFGAQAREMMLPEGSDKIAFWQKILESNPNNADVMDRLGKAYLNDQKTEQGLEYLRKAIDLDPGKNTLHLDIARYYLYQVMRDQSQLKELAPKMEEAYMAYYDSKPAPVNSMKAYAKGNVARIKSRTGSKEDAEKISKEADALDPNYSKATGIPDQNLFIPPDQIPHGFTYFSRPF